MNFLVERENMPGKDITEKVLEDYNDIFADIVNVLLYDGERQVAEEELKTISVHSQYKDEENILHEQERDVSKYWSKKGVNLVLYGIENQTKPEKKMPIRIFGYEGASYRSQLFSKKVAPVITMVLYFGTERHWNMSGNLKDILDIPDGLDKYVNDIHVNIFEIAWLTESQVNKFTSDFKIVANFFVNKRRNKDYEPDDKTQIKHVDEVLKLLSIMTGDRRYEKILSNNAGVRNMCDVAQRLEDRGIQKGIEQGQNALSDSIHRLKAGETAESIIASGIDAKTVELALTCL